MQIFSEGEWSEILDSFPKPNDEVKEAIWQKTRSSQPPMVEIDWESCRQDFNELVDLDTSSLIRQGDIFSRYEYSWDIGNLYIDSCNVGNKSSNFFHQENRYKCDSINAPSPYRTWNNKKFFFTLCNALWTLKVKDVSDKTLRSCIAMRKYVASQFRPSAAKAIYDRFNSSRVLDFSSGWGDRLSAAMASASVEKYVGIDPNTSLLNGYNDQIKSFNTGKDIRIISEPAEEATNKIQEKFDTIFTSPPYFIVERYSTEETQSWVRYKKLQNWLEWFLLKTIKSCWNLLEDDGHLVINISDVYCNHTINKICDPMNDFISMLPNAQKLENINYKMAKRKNSKSDKSGTFVEPIWIWKKTK